MTRRVQNALIVVVIAILASACGSNSQSPQPPQEVKVTTTSMSTTTTGLVTTSSTTVPSTTTTSTTISAPTTTATPSVCPEIDPTGQVLSKLTSLKFFDPKINGCSSEEFKNVVAAFQKFNRLEVTGVFTPELAQAILAAQPTATSHPGTEAVHTVVELDRQLLFLYRNGQLTHIQHVSTGADNLMPTPKGRFEIKEIYPGLVEESDHPMYFWQGDTRIDGVSIHGYPVVPYTEAASHGCVRLPLSDIMWLYDIVNQMETPMPVYVV